MLIYSLYHDEIFTCKGSARKAARSKINLFQVVSKYIYPDDIVDIHVVQELELEGVFAVQLEIILKNGITSMILVDSPLPLSFEQWQKLVDFLFHLN